MKWALLLVGALVVIVGALAGVGAFLLPNKLTVEQAIQIDRHRSMVFPLAANLTNFQEWSPWVRRDPSLAYIVTGSAGLGQTAAFRSASPQVGDGKYEIAAVDPNTAVTFALQGGVLGAGAAQSTLTLSMSDMSGGAATVWRFERICSTSWDSILCRFGNLFVETAAKVSLEQGLAGLKQLAEDLPALDISSVVVTVENRAPRQYAFVASEAAKDNPSSVANVLRGANEQVLQFLNERGIGPVGARVLVTTGDVAAGNGAQQILFNTGYLYDGPAIVDPPPPVRNGATPGGRAAMMVHEGSKAKLQTSYALLYAYLRAHRIEWRGLPWEIYVSDPSGDDDAARVEIYIPVK
jgi:effector-binding domain-containing protein